MKHLGDIICMQYRGKWGKVFDSLRIDAGKLVFVLELDQAQFRVVGIFAKELCIDSEVAGPR